MLQVFIGSVIMLIAVALGGDLFLQTVSLKSKFNEKMLQQILLENSLVLVESSARRRLSPLDFHRDVETAVGTAIDATAAPGYFVISSLNFPAVFTDGSAVPVAYQPEVTQTVRGKIYFTKTTATLKNLSATAIFPSSTDKVYHYLELIAELHENNAVGRVLGTSRRVVGWMGQ
jgi:hypothetical protein